MVTVRLPVCGGGAVQLTENDVDAVPPAGTLTVRDVPPLTEQLLATPDSTTVWLAAASPLNVTLPLVPVVTVRSPVVGGGGGVVQLTVKVVAATRPAMS